MSSSSLEYFTTDITVAEHIMINFIYCVVHACTMLVAMVSVLFAVKAMIAGHPVELQILQGRGLMTTLSTSRRERNNVCLNSTDFSLKFLTVPRMQSTHFSPRELQEKLPKIPQHHNSSFAVNGQQQRERMGELLMA